MNEVAKLEYIEKVNQLNEQQICCLLSMMPTSLKNSLDDGTITKLDAIAIQLEKEHTILHEWRINAIEAGSTHSHPRSFNTLRY